MESSEHCRIPQPAVASVYSHLPPHLAQQLAALPPMPQRGRGRGKGRGRAVTPAPAPLQYEELARRYTSLPPLQIRQTVRISLKI